MGHVTAMRLRGRWLTGGTLLLAALLLTGCAGLFAPKDPRPVDEIVAAAEDLVVRKAYFDASELYARAIYKDPANAGYYLRRGELLEAIGEVDQARKVYRVGMKKVPVDA